MKAFKEFLNEIKLQKFAGYRKGDTLEFNADIVNNKSVVKRGVVVANTKGTEDVTLKVDGKEVVVPYSKVKGVVSKVNEAIVHVSNNKLQLKAGGSEILITTKGNNVNIFIQEGSERIMFEGKSDDLKAIKDFFSKI